MKRKTIIRIILDVIIFSVAFLFPWWIAVLLAIVALWYFDYLEIIFLGAIIDALYGHYWFTIATFLLFVLSVYIKPRLAFYH